ncbi:hypothetical protein [Streptomyces sp. NBC_00207]|uniref:hypothetical protein n=1 Tax=unclassified Streptomyces TaxID=2593676 RepID=UPI00288425A6|nr:hypothetical protein [Streptomyces sp. DSM 41633]
MSDEAYAWTERGGHRTVVHQGPADPAPAGSTAVPLLAVTLGRTTHQCPGGWCAVRHDLLRRVHNARVIALGWVGLRWGRTGLERRRPALWG